MTNTGARGLAQPLIQRLTLSVFDAEQLSTAIRQAALEHRQLDTGPFSGELMGLHAGPVTLNSGRYSRTLRVRGHLPGAAVVLGTILEARRDGCINGYRFGARDLILYPAGAELDYLVPSDTRWAALQLPRSMLDDLGPSMDLLAQPQIFSASLPGCARVVGRIARLVDAQSLITLDAWQGELAALADDLRGITNQSARADTRPNYAERMRQLRLFEQLVRERIGEELRIPALCEAIGVAQRTLEQTFRNQLGVSPRRYLTILRLHAARDALLRGIDTDIAALAAACGIPHAGRFAGDYRELFGEPPSATARG